LECGDEILDPNLNRDPFEIAYREYRRKYCLLQPEELRDWRKTYKLTQEELARLLGIGLATISRYENGALQDESHDRLLRLTMDPSNLLKLIEKSEGVFAEEKEKRLKETLREVQANATSIDSSIYINLGNYEADEFSGYRKLDMSKLYSAILFFCKEGVTKTKLNKLLFYADFKHFREYTFSITGAKYAHIPFGPAPDNYEIYIGSLNSQGAVTVEEWEGTSKEGDMIVGDIISAAKKPDLSLFSATELRIMALVKEDFEICNAKQMTDFTHEEVGYQETKTGELISYHYANQLKH
jgi:putative zinc finger/helix-turn-helix YgiT family protein